MADRFCKTYFQSMILYDTMPNKWIVWGFFIFFTFSLLLQQSAEYFWQKDAPPLQKEILYSFSLGSSASHLWALLFLCVCRTFSGLSVLPNTAGLPSLPHHDSCLADTLQGTIFRGIQAQNAEKGETSKTLYSQGDVQSPKQFQ